MSQAKAVVAVNVADMLAEPDGRSERISQAIFGETAELGDSRSEFSEVTTPDGYRGWILSSQLSILETGERYPNPVRAVMVASLFLPLFREPDGRSERVALLTLGSVVEVAESDDAGAYSHVRLPDGRVAFTESAALIMPKYPDTASIGPNALVVGRGMIGVPYLWGGRTTFGLDCSGFVQRVFFLCGKILPRDARQQYDCADLEPVGREDTRAGDLIFFAGHSDPRERGITHVGLAQGDGRVLHASSARGVAPTTMEEALQNRDYAGARRFKG